MTPHDRARGLPLATKDPLPLTPPFAFTGVSTHVFPLRASLHALQRLCNSYYNVVPPEVGRFRAVVPYVYLMCLNYGQLSELITNVGWFAQREFLFCTPVEWYKVVNGRWVFHGWAMVTPYIYVDDDLSAPLGREVYGWPKTIAQVTSAPGDWLRDPAAPDTVARIVTSVFPELYGGLRLVSRPFLDIERDGPMMNLHAPLDARSPVAPWEIARHLGEAFAGFGRDALWLAQAMRIFDPNPGTTPAFLAQMAERLGPAFAPGGPGFLTNSLNLKQFREADVPTLFCYQALTNAPFQTTAFHGGGVLGEERLLLGDVSGGYTIRLHEYPSVSISETLGLEVHQKSRDGAAGVVALKPVLPFWYEVDMTYLTGVNLAWRANDGIWRSGSGAALRPKEQPAPASDPPLFNTTVGSAIDEVAGPFQFRDTTIRVLPLLANRGALNYFLYANINGALKSADGKQEVRLSEWVRPPINIDDHTSDVEVGGDLAYVYMTATTYGTVTSQTNNVGDWIESELAFLIPVKWERLGTDGVWIVEGVGLVPAFSFVPEIVAATSRVEVLGIPTLRAEFPEPKNAWMQGGEGVLNARQNLLTVNAEVMPSLEEGQQARMHSLVQVSVNDYEPGKAELASRMAPVEWAEILRTELDTKKSTQAQFPAECKIARALALQLLGNQVPISLYTLKQFRDVVDPNNACYQSLVRVSRRFDEIFDIREIEETIRVRIHDYPTLAIAQSLGLVAETIDEGEGHAGIIYATQAIRPFYLNATIHESLGERLVERVGNLPVMFFDRSGGSLLADNGPPITVDGAAETVQDQGDPCWMSTVMARAADRRRVGPSDITKEAARTALSRVDPQMVIEAMLSREWGNLFSDCRWRVGRRKIADNYDVLFEGGGAKEVAEAEAALFAEVDLGALPNMKPIVTQMIENLKAFTTLRFQMEGDFALLTNLAIAKASLGQDPLFRFSVPATPEQVTNAVIGLVQSIGSIVGRTVLGDPSPTNGLNTEVEGDYRRLGQLFVGPVAEVARLFQLASSESDAAAEPAGAGSPFSFSQAVEATASRVVPLRQAVRLARKYCDVQRQALLNKQARSFQKPDFCIKRDAVGPACDLLLPLSLSWDADWYCGRSMVDYQARDTFPNVMTTGQGV